MKNLKELETWLPELESIVEEKDRSRIPELLDLIAKRPPFLLLEEAAYWAIGRVADERDLLVLQSLLRKLRRPSRVYVTQAIIRLGSDEVRKQTVDYLMGRQRSLDDSLGGYHVRYPELVPFVEPYCQSPDWQIKMAARRFVDRQKTPPPEKVPRWERLQASDSEIASWLGQLPLLDGKPLRELSVNLARCESLPESSAGVIKDALEKVQLRADSDERYPLLTALGRTGNPTMADTLFTWMNTLFHKRAAAGALEAILEKSADRVSGPLLAKITGSPTELLDGYYHVNEFTDSSGVYAFDISRLKELARRELDRRS